MQITELALRARRPRQLQAVLAIIVALVVGTARPATASADAVLAQGAGMGAQPSLAVRHLQRTLHDHGLSLGRPGIDGRFGPLTAAAVRRLQRVYGLSSDGVVGAKTHRLVSLLAAAERRRSDPGPARPRSSARRSTAPAPVRAPAPAGGNAAPGTRSGPGRSDTGLIWAVAALGMVALAAFAVAVRSRRRPAPRTAAGAAPLVRQLFLEGESPDATIGAFRGYALAASLPQQGDDRTARFLVDDRHKPAPVWVNADEVRRSPAALEAGEAVVAYATIPESDGRSRSFDPARPLEEACERAGWEVVEVVRERENGGGLDRPGLTYALEQIASGRAGGLVVRRLRELSRSIADLGPLLEWFAEAEASLVVLDLDLDTGSERGRDVARALSAVAEIERERIVRRTRTGLAEARAAGRAVGRPAVSDRPELVARIAAMRRANMTLQAIADQLNAEGVPTLRGGAKWRPSSVQAAAGYKRPTARTPLEQLPRLDNGRRA